MKPSSPPPFDAETLSLPPALEPAVTSEDEADREARLWLEQVYQGDSVRQLSVRSIVSGMAIGAIMSVSNLYVGLKTGWGLGVTITSCIIAFSVFKALEAIVPAYRRRPFSILENNTMSSAASAAGYMSSSGLVSAIPALYLTTGRTLSWWEMMPWLMAVSLLGVFMAVPLKRQLINIDKLPFPSGIATAETLRSMHTAGRAAVQKARALGIAGAAGAILAFVRDAPMMGRFAMPSTFPLFFGTWAERLESNLTLGFEGSSIMVAAGAIMGIRVGVSLLLGALVYYGMIGPLLIDQGIVTAGYRGIVSWTLWPATAMMLTSSLVNLAFRWRSASRALFGVFALFGKKKDRIDPLAHVEVPGSWVFWGTAASGLLCVLLADRFFDVSPWMGVLAVFATFFLSVVAARATGETDVTPVSAMGKITQLSYAVIAPSNLTTNLMTAMITAGASAHAGDLLTDLKAGHLLGASARKQTIAQLFGILSGTLLCVPVYALVVRPEELGSAQLPAPAAKVWAGVAQMLAHGVEALPRGAVAAVAVGGVLGILLAVLEEVLPRKYGRFLPSATGLGIAGIIPAFNSISMFLGAFGTWLLARRRPEANEKYTISVASGLIAGESLMGVVVMLWMQAPALLRGLFGF